MTALTFLAALLLALPAHAAVERDYQEQLCTGMELEHVLPDGARVDCLSEMYAIEVGFSETWHESIGQALYYAAATGKQPGIILVCRQRWQTCLGHMTRLQLTLTAWQLPIAVWMYCGREECR